MSNEFWLYEWLDEYDVKSIKSVSRLLRPGDPSVGRLQELAAAWSDRKQPTRTEGTAILAGRGIDLSGDWDCCHLVSQRQYVDTLFSRVWHYFDEIVIVGPSGERFAHSLERLDGEATQSLRQRVSSDAALPAVVAEQIYEDVIEPGLNDVTRRLDVIQKALDRKLATGIAIGALITTVGVITGAPLIVGAGIAAMGSSVPVAQKYFDDKGSIELADMYFLWRLEQRANRHTEF